MTNLGRQKKETRKTNKSRNLSGGGRVAFCRRRQKSRRQKDVGSENCERVL